MVTKRTRLLSIVTTAIMLVSMLACFVIPAAAEDATLAALKEKYDILDPANFEGLEGTPIEDARAAIAEYIEQFNSTEEAALQEALVQLAQEVDADTTAAITGKVKESAELRYAQKGYYEAVGYPIDASTYLISEVEDWKAASAASSAFNGITLKVTKDIDFKDAGTLAPLVAPDVAFNGTLDGQGHSLKNMTVAATGKYAGALVGDMSKTAVIKNLILDGGAFTYTASGSDNWGAGTIAGHMSGGARVLNVGSSMNITGAIKDGKTGFGGLFGWSDADAKVDNCFYIGTATNTNGPATDFNGYAGGSGGTKFYNSIGAGTVSGTVLPNSMARYHVNLWGSNPNTQGEDETNTYRGEQAGTGYQVFYNTYAVGKDALSFRTNSIPLSQENATYFGLPYTQATVNAIHSAKDITEAAWLVNSNFDTTVQSEQTYFMDVQDGKLCFITDSSKTLKKVEFTGDVELSLYLHGGDVVNLVTDLEFQSDITELTITEGYEDAISDTFDLTVPDADIIVNVAYGEGGKLDEYKGELLKYKAMFDAVDLDLFKDENGDLAWWYNEYLPEALASDYLEDVEYCLYMITDELVIEFKDGVYPAFSEYEAYKPFNDANAWAITEPEDWLAAVDMGTAEDILNGKFYLTNDIDFGADCEAFAPLAAGGTFEGTLDGQGYAFYNVNVLLNSGSSTVAGLISVSGANAVIKDIGVSGRIEANINKYENAATFGKFSGAGEVTRVWSTADLVTNGADTRVAGIVVNALDTGVVINGAYFAGSISNKNTAGLGEDKLALTGNNSRKMYLYNAIADMADHDGVEGLARLNYTELTNSGKQLMENVYGVNFDPVFAWRDNPASDTFTAQSKASSALEAAWKVNHGQATATAAPEEVYFTLNENGEIRFGNADDQIRKVTFTGSVLKDVYVVPGDTITLSEIAEGAEFAVSTEGYADAIADGVLTVPNADITVNVTGDVVDQESYENGLVALPTFIATYKDMDTAILSNGADLAALLAEAEAALAADAAESTNDTKRAVIAAAGKAAFFAPALAEGKYVPYATKDTLFKGVAANGNYGIYNAADWAAFVAAGANAGNTIHLMKDVTLDASAPILGNTAFSGTFDGHENTLTVNVTAAVASGNKFGIFGNGGTIKNLKLAGSVVYAIGTEASPVTAHTFAAIVSGGGATVDNVTNDASFTVTGYGTQRMWVASMTGELGSVTNSVNNGVITFTGYSLSLAIGGINGRTNTVISIQNCENNGTITVNDTNATNGNVTYVGGICGTTAGNSLTNVTNNGDIIVNSGRRVVVGGIQGEGTDTNANCFINGDILNTGDIYVTLTKGGDLCRVGGIFGQRMWPVSEGATIKNTGNITIDANDPANGFQISGITNTMSAKATTAFTTAINEGTIWVGGTAKTNVAAQITHGSATLLSGTESGSIAYCAHEEFTSVEDILNGVVDHECDACSYAWQTDYEGGEDADYLVAKAQLEALAEKLAKFDLTLFEGADALAALKTEIDAALAADAAESTADTQAAIIALAAEEEPTLALAEGKYVPYSLKDTVYAEFVPAGTTSFAISTANDWIKLTEDFLGKACELNLYVTNDIYFNNTNMSPLSYGSGIVSRANIYGNGYTFHDIKIEMEGGTNQYQGVALIGAMAGGGIYDLGVTGNVYNTSTSTSARTAVFSGGATAGGAPIIKNCWTSVHVKGPSSNRSQYLSVFYAVPNSNDAMKIENCINYGTVETTSSGGGVSVFYNYGAQAAMKNSLDLGTLIGKGGVVGAIASHHNGLADFIDDNSYSINGFWGWTHPTFEAEIVDQNVTIPGTTEVFTTAQQIYDYFAVSSAAEAAWRATNGANGEVYYKLDATKGVVFGSATDRVQKITFIGDVESVVYLNNGSTITLADIADNATFDIGGVEIEGDTYTVPNADVTINVVSGSSVDLIAYAAAKAELEAMISKFGALRMDLFTNGADMTAAMDAAAAVLAADEESTDATKQAIIDEAAKADVVPVLKSDAKVPYGKKDLYAEYGASTTAYGIYEKEDWIAATLVNGTFEGVSFYVMNDIYFGNTNMAPLSYAPNVFRGNIYGQGHTFYDIKIEMAGGTGQYNGVSLVSALAGGTIDGLGVTGFVTNTSTAYGSARTAVFSGGANAGAQGTISNCWSSVTVTGPSDGSGKFLAVFQGTANANLIKNCINVGTVVSSNGSMSGVFYTYGAQSVTTNSLDLGTGANASIVSHGNGSGNVNNNNWSVNEDLWYFTTGAPETAVTLPDGSTADTTEKVNAYYRVGSAAEAAWKATNGANGAVYYKLDDAKIVTFGTATDRVQKITFTGDVETVVYLNNGSTITLADIHDDATFSIEGTPIDGDTYIVPNADVVITVTDNNPECEHALGEKVHIEGTNTHQFVCGECGETVGEPEVCGELTWAEDAETKTHSATCPECEFVYTEDCVGTEKFDATDCTKDHWYEYDCDRENETIVGTGADAHVWGEWTTEGATAGYQRHDCDNCDQYEEELLPLAAPVIVITTNVGKAGETGVEFTVTLTEAAIKGGTITITLPEWAKNVALVAGANVSIDGLVATITGDIAAGSVLLTGTYDIDNLAGATAAITATAAGILDANGEAVEVAVATADAAIDVIVGDAKVDGVVNLIDAIAVLRAVAGLDADVNAANGDADMSGALSADDAVLIVRWWLGDPEYQGPEMGV